MKELQDSLCIHVGACTVVASIGLYNCNKPDFSCSAVDKILFIMNTIVIHAPQDIVQMQYLTASEQTDVNYVLT